MESILAATVAQNPQPEKNESNILGEIANSNLNSSRRRAVTTITKSNTKDVGVANDENKLQGGSFSDSIKLAKKIHTEAGSWFMDFLEVALESGLKKPKRATVNGGCCCPQSLILKVLTGWRWSRVMEAKDLSIQRHLRLQGS
ncbi:hypothetical protein QJS10_CPB12g00203 [Acorus calamus]|uniref:DUF6857 domain-containing protein n=1 Tax=Acorus calamus TaxID=4465 RepID=A0AAV9DMH5_ACOCL|nr:hypothetical protein QJS10_CPB12g00203 [Acorus calamus]